MKYIKTFEDSFYNDDKKLYPFEILTPFINWFGNVNRDIMKKEGWIISYSDFDSSNFSLPKFNFNKVSGYWQVQRNDDDDIIEDDIAAEKLAKEHGLLMDDEGVVIGYNDISFIDYPEELEKYENINKYNF